MAFWTRRDFLRNSGALGAALASGGLAGVAEAAPSGNQGSGEGLNVAVIGVNGRGVNHVQGFAGKNNCVVTHICDADSAVVRRAMQTARKQQGSEPRYVQDLRRIMDDQSIQIVSIATPNHWHALAAIWAMQAGKDVYVEKPVSHNVSEGRRIVEVARRTNKICQAGTQIRSNPGSRQAIEFLQSGKLGKVQVARALCYKRRSSIGRANGDQAIPSTIDYDLWCGPAPNRPLTRCRLHYDWHWIWDYGNGDLGNQGIHQMDVARWGLGKTGLARSVLSVGGRFGYVDDGETANTQIAVFDYGDAELIFEVRGLETKPLRGVMVGNIFHCSDGVLVCPNYSSAIAYNPRGEVIQRFQGGTDQNHYDNFVGAVRSRRYQDLNGEILEGHLSSALCHLANISYRLGRPTHFNGSSKAFGDDRAAGETFSHMAEHLRDSSVPLEKTDYRLGRRLTIDAKTERFENDAEANRYLTREYRRGFEVPPRG
jgi:predicted dehydrogenase